MEFFSNIWLRIKAWRTYSNYLIVGIIVFILGVFVHFPLERFGSVITSTIQKNTGYVVQMEKLSLTLPIGVFAENVKIQPPPGIQPFVLGIDKLTIRPSIFALLTYPFRKAFGFSYKAVRGKEIWSGSVSMGNENSSLSLSVKNFAWASVFPLDQNPMFAGQSVSIDTIVDIDFDIAGKTVALQQSNLSEATGSLDIKSKKTDILAPMVKSLKLSDLTLNSDLKKGTLNIKKFDFKAPNLSGKTTGSIQIAPDFPSSKLSLDSVIKPDASDANLTSLIQLVGTMYNITPASDGSISLKVNGSLNSPETLTIRSF